MHLPFSPGICIKSYFFLYSRGRSPPVFIGGAIICTWPWLSVISTYTSHPIYRMFVIPYIKITSYNWFLWPFSHENLHFPMVFLWFSYGFPMVFHGKWPCGSRVRAEAAKLLRAAWTMAAGKARFLLKENLRFETWLYNLIQHDFTWKNLQTHDGSMVLLYMVLHGSHQYTPVMLAWFWVNYNISLTWIIRPFGDDFPY